MASERGVVVVMRTTRHRSEEGEDDGRGGREGGGIGWYPREVRARYEEEREMEEQRERLAWEREQEEYLIMMREQERGRGVYHHANAVNAVNAVNAAAGGRSGSGASSSLNVRTNDMERREMGRQFGAGSGSVVVGGGGGVAPPPPPPRVTNASYGGTGSSFAAALRRATLATTTTHRRGFTDIQRRQVWNINSQGSGRVNGFGASTTSATSAVAAAAAASMSGNTIIGFLHRRELGMHHRQHRRLCGNQARNSRRLYEFIVPDTSYEDVEDCPQCHLRRFTDDGKLLLGFTGGLGGSFVAFRFRSHAFPSPRLEANPPAVGHVHASVASTPANGDTAVANTSVAGAVAAAPARSHVRELQPRAPASHARARVSFNDVFETAFETNVCRQPEVLCKDFCISVLDGSMVLLASYALISGDTVTGTAASNALNGNGAGGTGGDSADDSIDVPCVPGLPGYSRLRFHVLRLSDGRVVDSYTLFNSFVNLTHNGGVHVMNNLVLVLNLRMQKVHILHLENDGRLVEGVCVGPHCFDDDELVLRSHRDNEARFRAMRRRPHAADDHVVAAGFTDDGDMDDAGDSPRHRGLGGIGGIVNQDASTSASKDRREMLSGLKQRLMAYILRDAQARDRMNDRKDAVRTFYSKFELLSKLYFTRAQFLSRHYLLLRMSGIEGIASRSSDAAQQNAYFVVYNFVEAKVEGFYRNTDEALLRVVEENIASLSLPAGAAPWVQLATVFDGLRKRSSPHEATPSVNTVKRALYSLPPAPMSYCCSPYLDPTLFQYDEKMVSTADRPRPCAEHPVRFLLKSRPGVLSFKIAPPFSSCGGDGRGKKLVAYIFHPFFPFVVSILHGTSSVGANGAGLRPHTMISFHTSTR